MQRFKVNREPHRTQFLESMKGTYLYFEGDALVGFNDTHIKTLVKATGLRSKKSRKMIKRFKKVIQQLIIDGIEEYEHGREKK